MLLSIEQSVCTTTSWSRTRSSVSDTKPRLIRASYHDGFIARRGNLAWVKAQNWRFFLVKTRFSYSVRGLACVPGTNTHIYTQTSRRPQISLYHHVVSCLICTQVSIATKELKCGRKLVRHIGLPLPRRLPVGMAADKVLADFYPRKWQLTTRCSVRGLQLQSEQSEWKQSSVM